MRDECELAMADALGRPLRKGEADEVEDSINLQMRLLARQDTQAWLGMTQQQRLEMAAKASVQSVVADLKLRQQRISLQIAAHDRIENSIQQAFARLPENAKPGAKLGVVSELLAFSSAGHGIASADSAASAIRNEAIGQLFPLWSSVKGFAHLFENSKGVSDLIHEFFGEDSGNAAAKGGAAAWFKGTDALRDRANAAGANIGKLDNWHLPQSHSQSRVAVAGLDQWAADTTGWLDRSMYLHADGTRMTDAELHEGLLPAAFDSITTDGMNKQRVGFKRRTTAGEQTATYAAGGFGNFGDRGSAHRQLFFKDADSYLAYQAKYGERSLWPTLVGHISTMSRDIAMLETLGPNPEGAFKYFNDRTHLDELRENGTAANSINAKAKYNESLYDVVAGQNAVVNNKIADAGAAFRNFETATKLGSVAITALGDQAGMAATCFANKVPWSESLMTELRLMFSSKLRNDAATHAYLGINSVIGGLNRFGRDDFQLTGGAGWLASARTFTSKLATGVLSASGAEWMWDLRRKALGMVLMSYLGKWTREAANFKDLSFDDAGWLTHKGVTENDWQVWKQAQLEDMGMKHGVLTPKSVMDIPDEKLAGMSLHGTPDQLRRHAATMLLGHTLEETGMGVMDTGARERAKTLLGTTAGTVPGELTRAALLFKSFSFSMMMKHWARAAAMPTVGTKAQYAATLMVTGTIMGMVANQLRNLVSGKDPQNVAEPRAWAEAMLRGGGLGFYGDFLYDAANSYDESPTEAVMGPGATTIADLYNLTGKPLFQAAQGKRTDEGANLIRFARGNIPFLNMWYTKLAFDHLIWNNMQEAASPGYLDRMQAKAYANRGTTFWFAPGASAPAAPPDLSKVWQPDLGRQQMQTIADRSGIE